MSLTPDLVLFDLDGTFADTAPDLAHALNRTLTEQRRPPLPFERIRPVVSLGGTALIRLGFVDVDESDPRFAQYRSRFLDIYLEDIAGHTCLFPGMTEVLARLEARHRRWGIVTNKPAWLTDPLLQALDLARRACCVVSGDTLPRRKPHPDPLLHACNMAGVAPAAAVYVGDARRDVDAARAAGMPVIVARYGYIPADEDPAAWGGDAVIDSPLALLHLLAD